MRLSNKAVSVTAQAIALASVAVAGFATLLAVHDGLTWTRFAHEQLGFSLVLVATMPILGAFLLARHPGNRLGWVFCLVGPLRGMAVLADVWAHHTYVSAPGSLPGGSIASLMFAVGPLFLLPTVPLMVLWFPDGRAPSWAWRRVEVAPVLLVVCLVGTLAFAWPYRGPQLLLDSPDLDGWRATAAQVCMAAAVVVVVPAFIAAFCSLIWRLRRSEPATRAQVKWVLFGIGAAFVLDVVGDVSHALAPLRVVAVVVPELFIVVAIERYRLWEIDRLINRTVVYGLLTLVIAAVYASAAISLGLVIGGTGAESTFAVAGATLLVAVMFAPARRRIQLAVDRRFDRRAFDALTRVRDFADRLGHDAQDPGELQLLLADVLRDPDLSLCFVTSAGGLLDSAGVDVDRPLEDEQRTVVVAGSDAEPIALIGYRRGLDGEGRLLLDVVRAARASLEYARLQAELQVQLVAIQRSRMRLVEATDNERRRIERDLHDGAQQRLVALALRLRTEQRQHVVAAGSRLDDLLSTTVAELQSAVADLRSMTHGMLPPVLTSGGAAAALRELVGRYDGKVDLLSAPTHRHAAIVEATAWFVASEGLANATKHAVDANVTVRADCTDGKLRVAICDDGPGGASLDGSGLRGLNDRVDACGGRLTLRSPPSGGTELIAVLPCV